MSEPLPVVVIGLGDFGARTAAALVQSDVAELVGVADPQREQSDHVGQELKVPAFDDTRSCLAETHPAAAFLAVPPMAVPDLLGECVRRKVHVWKEAPLARNLDEGVSMLQAVQQAGLKLAVGTQRRFAKPYARGRALVDQLGPIALARAHYLFQWGPIVGWRGHRRSAGGGALLELGYHPVDLLLWMLGVPEEAYGLSARGEPRGGTDAEGRPPPPYDTDDTAAALLRYSGGRMATMVASRASGPVSEAVWLHGRDGSLTATPQGCVLRDPDGRIRDCTTNDEPPLAVFRRQAEAFCRAVTDEAATYEASGWENLLTLAVVEAIYLSGRTAQPESPANLLRPHGLTPDDCLRLRPVKPEA